MECIVNVVTKSGIRDRLPTPVFLGFPWGLASKESTCNVGDLGLNGYPLQYSGLENSMHGIVHGVGKSWTRLSDFHYTVDLLISHN